MQLIRAHMINGHKLNFYGLQDAWNYLEARGLAVDLFVKNSNKELLDAFALVGAGSVSLDSDRGYRDVADRKTRLSVEEAFSKVVVLDDMEQVERELNGLLVHTQRVQDAIKLTLQGLRNGKAHQLEQPDAKKTA